MLTLYHSPMSRSSRIIWLLEELEADYEIAYVDIPRRDGSGASDPNNPHPQKKVPFLTNGEVQVWESVAIALYAADLYPDSPIVPAPTDADRGAYVSWMTYYAATFEPMMMLSMMGLADDERVSGSSAFGTIPKAHELISAALEAGPYIAGDRFTAADVFLAGAGQWAREILPAGEVVDAYLERCYGRPALARAQAKDAKP